MLVETYPVSIRPAFRLNGQTAVIRLEPRFAAEYRQRFTQATEEALKSREVRELQLDFTDVRYIDSCAMGLMMLLRRQAHGRRVSLVNCDNSVKNTLRDAHFGTLFAIS